MPAAPPSSLQLKDQSTKAIRTGNKRKGKYWWWEHSLFPIAGDSTEQLRSHGHSAASSGVAASA